MTATETPSAPVSTQIHLSTTVEYEQVSCNDTKDLYVMASLVAPSTESEERQTRAPIDIVACIDISGSMAGEKLKLVRASLEFMVDQLKDEDSLCLVLFDDKVETRLQMTQMTKSGRQLATDIIKGIRDGGSTNLSGAIFQGFEEIKRRTNPRDVATILLFTDGLANVGITDSKSIVAGAEKYLQNIGKAVSLFTFGFGSDHDPNMLRAIAEAGNGLYYYLQREDEIPQSFADCLGGLLSVAAQNIRLKIETLDNGIVLKTVHSAYKKLIETTNCVELSIGDLYSEESKDIVLEVTLNQLRSELEKQDLVKFTLSYYNVKELNSETLEVNATVGRPTQAPSDQKQNPELQKQRHRVDTANALQRGRELADSGRLEEAKQVLVDTRQILAQSEHCEDNYTTNLMSDLYRVSEGMNSASSYASYGSKMANSAWSENHRQRSNKPISMFKTKQKKSMEEKYEREYKK